MLAESVPEPCSRSRLPCLETDSSSARPRNATEYDGVVGQNVVSSKRGETRAEIVG